MQKWAGKMMMMNGVRQLSQFPLFDSDFRCAEKAADAEIEIKPKAQKKSEWLVPRETLVSFFLGFVLMFKVDERGKLYFVYISQVR